MQDFHTKVKQNGFIMGHDYTNHRGAQGMDFGVVRAVDEFVARHGWHFVALTVENFPTYVLSRSSESEQTKLLVLRLLYNVSGIVEIREYPGKEFVHKVYPFDAGKVACVLSF